MVRERTVGRPLRRPVVRGGLIVLATLAALLVTLGVALVLGLRPVVDVAVALDAPRTTSWRALEQTWPRAYGATTCRDWHDDLSYEQQTVAAAELLVLSLARDGYPRRPSDADVEDLRFNISEVCVEQPDATVGDVGARIYRRFSGGYRWGVEATLS